MIEIFKAHPWVFSCAVGFLSLFIGSFLNVVIYRLPLMLLEDTKVNLLFPRSHCPQCKTTIKWFHNVPLFSFLWLKGRCGYCQKPLSAQYPLVELLTAVLSFWVATRFGFSTTALLVLLLTWALITLSVIDIHHTILPDTITLPFLWLGLLANTFGAFTSPSFAILGAASGYLVLWSFYWVFKLLTKKEGMGYGDFKLLAMLGAWFGWQALPFIIFISSVLGSVVGVSLILLKRKSRCSEIPFGPYLAIGGFAYLFLHRELLVHYLRYISL